MIPSRLLQSLKKTLQSTEATNSNVILKKISLHTIDGVTSNLSPFLLQIRDVSGRDFINITIQKDPFT